MTITGAFPGFTLALRTPGSYFPTCAEAEGWGGGGESSCEEQVDSDGREQEMSSLHGQTASVCVAEASPRALLGAGVFGRSSLSHAARVNASRVLCLQPRGLRRRPPASS